MYTTSRSGGAAARTVAPSTAGVKTHPGGNPWGRIALEWARPALVIPESVHAAIVKLNPPGGSHVAFGVPPVKFRVTSTKPSGISWMVGSWMGPAVPDGT